MIKNLIIMLVVAAALYTTNTGSDAYPVSDPGDVNGEEMLTVTFVNEVETGDVWLLENTEENLKTSVWGKAHIKGAASGSKNTLTVPRSSDDTYLFRMIDEDGLYFESDAITIKDGYTIKVSRGADEYDTATLEIADSTGDVVETLSIFCAAL